MNPTPSQETLLQEFTYNPAGWLERSGQRAGYFNAKGYRIISVGNIGCREHRLIWKMHHGVDAPGEIDHINEDKADNRIENLRVVTTGFNTRRARRSKKGLPPGVSNSRGKYQATIYFDGRRRHLGMFATPEEAGAAYQSAVEGRGPGIL